MPLGQFEAKRITYAFTTFVYWCSWAGMSGESFVGHRRRTVSRGAKATGGGDNGMEIPFSRLAYGGAISAWLSHQRPLASTAAAPGEAGKTGAEASGE